MKFMFYLPWYWWRRNFWAWIKVQSILLSLCFLVIILSTAKRNDGIAMGFQGTRQSRMIPNKISESYNYPFLISKRKTNWNRPSSLPSLFDTERTVSKMILTVHMTNELEAPVSFLRTKNSTQDISLPTENGGFTHTSASKAKISAANKGKTPWNKGKSRSVEERERIAAGVRARNRERFLEKLDAMGLTEEQYEQKKRDERNKKAAERRSRKTENGGYRPTEETKHKISQILKEKWANGDIPRHRTDPSKIRSGFKHSEETKAKISESLKKKWSSDTTYRLNMVNKTTISNTQGDMRQKVSETLKKKWQDPEFRQRMMEKIRSRKNSALERNDEYRRKISEAMKIKWQDTNYRNRTVASIRQNVVKKIKEGPPKAVKAKPIKGESVTISKVRLAKVAIPKQPKRDRVPLQLNDDGELLVHKKKMVKKKKKKMQKTIMKVQAVSPLTPPEQSRKSAVAKLKKLEKENPKEPDGSINRLRDERRDLYDLLYGDEDFDNDLVESFPGTRISTLLDMEDDNLERFDPYGLEDY
jgi:translation initiation factor 1 (eIF-1/SUI1)